MSRILIANRGEIACRIIQAVEGLNMVSVLAYSEDEKDSLPVRLASHSVLLPRKRGTAAYLDIDQLIEVAKASDCVAVHPGYGFLSESAEFAKSCAVSGLVFIGPPSSTLELFGNKVATRKFATSVNVEVVPGEQVSSPEELSSFYRRNILEKQLADGVMLKASYGGGGRGMRVIRRIEDVPEAFERCASESMQAFGNDELFVELFIEQAKHIEVQIAAYSPSHIEAFGERECSVQRQNQKVVEFTPCPSLAPNLRQHLVEQSIQLAKASGLVGLGTFEFLVTSSSRAFFIECNPRLQVEHTVTEEVWGIDLVQTQIQIALGLNPPSPDRKMNGYSMQLRVNLESLNPNGTAKPDFGTVSFLQVPGGKDVRFDSAAFVGFKSNPMFDSLLAKLIVWAPDFPTLVKRAGRILQHELIVRGVATNISFLLATLEHPDFVDNAKLTTRFLSNNVKALVSRSLELQQALLATQSIAQGQEEDGMVSTEGYMENVIVSPIHGEVMQLYVKPGDVVNVGDRVAVLNAFKMEHEIESTQTGKVLSLCVQPGDIIKENQILVELENDDNATQARDTTGKSKIDLDKYTRSDLEYLYERRLKLEDEFRKERIEQRRHQIGRRSARANVMDLVDEGTFAEYGSMALAAQSHRHSLEDLIDSTQGDGVVGGLASVNADLFPSDDTKARTSCVVFSYDYLVLAGTQGVRGHLKKDRLFRISRDHELPVVIFTEGGGGRPGDYTGSPNPGLNLHTFALFGDSTKGVRIGVGSGYNFAGNAILLGMCDVIIGTRDCNIGVGGPAMVEFAGQGKVNPTDLGPAMMQYKNGVIHVLVEDEREAVVQSKRILAYFQGKMSSWNCADQRILRTIVPEKRTQAYNMRRVIDAISDYDSVTELAGGYGKSVLACLARVEGYPIGVLANQPLVLGGALDADACDKCTYFLDLCDRFRLPVVHLCDCPGFIVGTEYEKHGLVGKVGKFYSKASQLKTKCMTVVTRKAVGLGAMSMDAGAMQFKSIFSVTWPTGSFAGMGIEGAVRLGFRKQLSAIDDPIEREKTFQFMVDKAYAAGSAMSIANAFAIDEVIDPVDTRKWIVRGLESINHSKYVKL